MFLRLYLHISQFYRDRSAGTLIFAAIVFPILIVTMALVVDIGRIYTVQAKAQNASDAALLGAVATISTNDLTLETVRLFNANYPAEYMGSTVSDISVQKVSSGVYEANYTVTVPTTITGIFSSDIATLQIFSQVTRGLDVTENLKLELSLVLDNTGSMGGTKIEALKSASTDLTNILFGDADSLQNLHISVVPYDVAVNLGPDRAGWIQGAYLPIYNAMAAGGNGYVSNRNSDSPRNALNDFTDAPPQTEETRFRVPISAPSAGCADRPYDTQPMRFAMNNRAEILGIINGMVASGCTRINVGLMWGWFALSPFWQGIWDAGSPSLPRPTGSLVSKVTVLMSDGRNTVYNGSNGTSNDDESTATLCAAMKAQGVTLYTVGFGAGADENLLRSCATSASHYWFAPNADDLGTAFSQIADDILFNTLRLSR